MTRFIIGNVLLILCGAFYLAWWIIAFRPVGAVKGMQSGWLLIPAALFGLAAVIAICGAISVTDSAAQLVPTMPVVVIGAAAYCLLLAVTGLLMKRQVTTELLLIVGWATLTAAQISALYGHGVYTAPAAWVFIAVVLVLAALSLVCYLLYYNLDAQAGYIDGMIPLALVMIVAAAMNVTIVL